MNLFMFHVVSLLGIGHLERHVALEQCCARDRWLTEMITYEQPYSEYERCSKNYEQNRQNNNRCHKCAVRLHAGFSRLV